ncbi:MAG: 23S rRNA (pseudouridine(1915)-N(3))-methyltransferase RlmH [Candidatus Altiarchaeota archaeon]|nr:23S rRNA (pseudouridine(1915)-N(3))-methyltransferase RlmH [Candidatus Altiarchaeota archaeon]
MIRILCVGRLKEKFLQDAAFEYLKRLGKYVRLEIVEFRECADKNPDVSKRLEGEQILAKIKPGEYVVVLDGSGGQFSSLEFSELLKKPDLSFVVGGPDGLSDGVKAKAGLIMGLSRMTFTHQMVRVFLLEQIYRGFTILKNERYHK